MIRLVLVGCAVGVAILVAASRALQQVDAWSSGVRLLEEALVECADGLAEQDHVAKAPLRILFLVAREAYANQMDRWYFEMFSAAKSIRGWDAEMWGPGFEGWDDASCGCTTPSADVERESRLKGGRQRLLGADRSRVVLRCGENEQRVSEDICKPGQSRMRRKLNAGEKISFRFGIDHPFDLILPHYTTRTDPEVKERSKFSGLPSSTLFALLVHEPDSKILRHARDLNPDIFFNAYVDPFEENVMLRRHLHRNVELERKIESVMMSDSAATLDGEAFAKELADQQLAFEDLSHTALSVFLPHGALSTCYGAEVFRTAGSEGSVMKVNRTSTGVESIDRYLAEHQLPVDQARPVDILFAGAIRKFYPSRIVMLQLMEAPPDEIDMTKNIFQLQHPSYEFKFQNMTDEKILHHSRQSHKTFIGAIANSKIAFIGNIATWTVRKYIEAMAGGCLVVGDVPADSAIAPFVVDAGLKAPNVCNPDEQLHRQAVASLAGLRGGVAELPERQSILDFDNRDMLAKCDVDVSGRKLNLLLGKRLDEVRTKFLAREYDSRIREARDEFLEMRNYADLLLDVLQPAVTARRADERGWLRTPSYFDNVGRKYQTRHKYLLAEWLLRETEDGRKTRSDRMKEYVSLDFDSLLSIATRELARKFDCPVEGEAGEACISSLYFPGMAQFDWNFILRSKAYLNEVAFDRFSDRYYPRPFARMSLLERWWSAFSEKYYFR